MKRPFSRLAIPALLALGLPLIPDTSIAQPACGAEGQRPCTLFERVPSCNAGLVERPGQCVHPSCGRDGERACNVGERIPSCDGSLVELAGRCYVRGQCGAEGQRACAVVERVPSCNAGLVERSGQCTHPPCGRQGERACNVNERIPSCDGALVEQAGQCQARGQCGAEGQRACAVVEWVPSCDVNLAERAGKCVHPECGRMGERGCPVTEHPGLGVACDKGLVEAPGCTGDCRGSNTTCMNPSLPLTEPTTNSTPLPATDPMRGFADIHVHMFSNLAFGGGVMVGAAYDPNGGIAKALAPDYGTDLDLVVPLGDAPTNPVPNPAHGSQQTVKACPPLVPHCGRNLLHGDHVGALDDIMGYGTHDGSGSYFGAPLFNGWPTWHTTTHQQVYYKWLERAWHGGMRLMTMLAVSNESACGLSKHLRGTDCKTNSMPAVDLQLQAAKDFEAWHKRQPGGGWFEIVYAPDDAERVIRSGRLAVVLGIEVDSLFGCKQKSGCTKESVAAAVDAYYQAGVRHIFPTHDFDGAFAGTAFFIKDLATGNKMIEQAPFAKAVPCPDISDFAVDDTVGCNPKGLTQLGIDLITKLMDKRMLIDIDHMSAAAIDQTIKMALAHQRYPLMASHALFGDLYAAAGKRHERMRTRPQLEALRQLGGLVSVMTQDEMEFDPECKRSSTTFIKNYNYAVDRMGNAPDAAPRTGQGAVAFGSDFNGMAQHVGPRFGDDACDRDKRQGAVQQNRLRYPFRLEGFGVFEKQVTGQRTFDFNTDGLAHIGLLPDLIAEMQQRNVKIEPLMKSAAAYVDAWRRTQSKGAGPRPVPVPRPLPDKGGADMR